jgi:hypothetical protein
LKSQILTKLIRNTLRPEVERTELKNHLEARGSRRGTPNTPTGVKEKI